MLAHPFGRSPGDWQAFDIVFEPLDRRGFLERTWGAAPLRSVLRGRAAPERSDRNRQTLDGHGRGLGAPPLRANTGPEQPDATFDLYVVADPYRQLAQHGRRTERHILQNQRAR